MIDLPQSCDILIAGGGMGGIAAAIVAAKSGKRVCVTNETDWIGGQMTAQGVPPDENPWIDRENTGCTASYRNVRDRIREYYRRNYPLKPGVAADPLAAASVANWRITAVGILARARQYAPVFYEQAFCPRATRNTATRETAARKLRCSLLNNTWERNAHNVTAGV